MRAFTKVVLTRGLLVSLLIATPGLIVRVAYAVNEFPSEPSSRQKAEARFKARAPEIRRVLGKDRPADGPAPARRGTSDGPVPTNQRVTEPAGPTHHARPREVWLPPQLPHLVIVPDVTGRAAEVAGAVLQRSGLALGQRHGEDSEAATGTVLRQSPPAGTPVPPGTPVAIVIAVSVTVPVPDLIRQPSDQAREILTHEKLAMGGSRARPSEARAGTVVDQTPIAGTRVRPGTAVDIVVAVPFLVTVPDVTRHSPEEAREVLSRYRLGLGDRRRQESEQPTGMILSQSPVAGTRVRPESAVDIVIAAPVLISVPDITHRAAEEARDLLTRSSLQLGERRRQESDAPAGTVVSQSPFAGTRVKRGAAVDVVVAAPTLVTVPDVTRRSSEEAKDLLARSTLALGERRRQESQAPAGSVVGQSPAAGARVRPGSPVNLVVAIPIPPPVAPPPPPPAEPAPIHGPTTGGSERSIAPGGQPAQPPSPALSDRASMPRTEPADTGAPVTSSPRAPQPAPDVRDTHLPVTHGQTPAAPAVQEPPEPRAPGRTPWPRRVTWGFGSALFLLGTTATIYGYRTKRAPRQRPPASSGLDYVPQWDPGIQQIGPSEPLSSSGLRLQSGLEIATLRVDDEHFVGAVHDDGGH